MRKSLIEAYAQFAPFYRLVGLKRGHFKSQFKFVNKLLMQYRIEGNILDASCGTGDVLNQLIQEHPSLSFWGSDGSPDLIAQAATLPNIDKTKLKLASWERISTDFNYQQFDFIYILGNSIGHCDSIRYFIKVINQVSILLKQGGIFCIDVRKWDENLSDMSFNAPNYIEQSTIDLNVGNMKYTYLTQYYFDTNKHHLVHRIQRNHNSNFNSVIDLPFIEIPVDRICKLFTRLNFKILNISDSLKAYPFMSILVQKCNC